MLLPQRLEIEGLAKSPPPVDLSLIKMLCGIDGDEFDALLTNYLFAAIAWAERSTHRTIFARSHSWVLLEFPTTDSQEIHLPRGKTRSVESVQFVIGGNVVTLRGTSSGRLGGSDYREDLRGDDGGVIVPFRYEGWPAVDFDVPAPVVINFTAGWLAEEVPIDIINALLFAVSDAFEMRGEADMTAGKNFQTRNADQWYRLAKWYL
jgi:hypothetical protein